MPNLGKSRDADLHHALEVYIAYLERQRSEDDDSLEVLCGQHPALAEDLRKLHRFAALIESLAASPAFHRSVRDLFGEEAEVKLTLDEGELTPQDAKATMMDTSGAPSSETASRVQTPDRYTLHGELARGGMGVIYKVRDRELNRTLAMKVMLVAPPATSLSHPMREGRGEGFPTSHPPLARFLEEVQVTAQLDHPGIVAVHELGLDAAGRPYFTMKLVRGAT